jgi:hypothetical protein
MNTMSGEVDFGWTCLPWVVDLPVPSVAVATQAMPVRGYGRWLFSKAARARASSIAL